MADIYGSHFEYAGVNSRKYGLIFASAESSRFTNMEGPVSSVTIFDRTRSSRLLVDTDYSDSALSFEIDILTDDGRTIEFEERRLIERWLFNQQTYRKLYMDMADDTDGETFEIINGEQKRLYLRCRFMNPVKLEYNGGLVGYRVTLDADSNMWWQDNIVYSYTFNPNELLSPFYAEVDSDVLDYTYPIVRFTTSNQHSTDDELRIQNLSDNGSIVLLEGITPSTTVTLNCELNMIVSGGTYGNLYRQKFLRLVNGKNSLMVYGGITNLELEFANRRRF